MDYIFLSGHSTGFWNPTTIFGVVSITLMLTLAILAILSTFIEHKHIHFLSEASIAILLGFCIGITYLLAVYMRKSNTNKVIPAFDQTFFFFVLLPIIVFKEGYSLNKQHFFKNFFYVALYGILGTIVNFVLVAAMTYLMVQQNWIFPNSSNPKFDEHHSNLFMVMYFAACISSKDSAVTLQVLNFDLTPKLHSIIFGEQILNDVVVFSLQKSVENIGGEEEVIENKWYTAFLFIGVIIEQLLVSFLVGVFIGGLATWITKQCRFFVHHSSIITAFTVYCGYLSFALCEVGGFCGVVAVLVCGAILSHYLSYNLPKISAQSSKITVKSIAYVSESFIYFYIGFSLTTLGEEAANDSKLTGSETYISYTLVLAQLFVIIPLARLLALLFTHLFAIVFRIKTKGKWRINRYEFFIIFFAGLIRGVVSYALIQEKKAGICQEEDPIEQELCYSGNIELLMVQSTTLLVCLSTTLFIGGSLKYVVEWCFYQMEECNMRKSSISDNGIRATFIAEDIDEYKQVHPKSEKLFKKIDEEWLKPLLIYNYKERKEDIKQAKKEERAKLKREEESEEKMFDDSVRHRRLNKSVSNSHSASKLSNSGQQDYQCEMSVKPEHNNQASGEQEHIQPDQQSPQ